jgi:Type I phosphodiesterase / nucleotide pyrophosphatase
MKYRLIFILITVLGFSVQAQKTKTENIILITLDGMRWQEIFNGADSSFMKQQQHLKDEHLKLKYWRDDLSERRKALLPFFWNTIASKGQLYGNRTLGSKVDVTNNQLFSYPGYNELLTGHADNERVHSNDKFYNPNMNVLEFINAQPDFKGKVSAFTSWDVFPFIINNKRSDVSVSTGWEPIKDSKLTDREVMLNQLTQSLPNPLGDVRLDAFTFYYGMEYLKKNKPRVMYFAFDETDDFAHGGEYGAYLNAAHYTDRFMSELWSYLQSDASYKNKTTLIITCDHGRGNDAVGWKDHGQKIPESSQIWFAFLGPDSPATGEMKTEQQLYQNQVAKTLATFLGLNYSNEKPVGQIVTSAILK